MKSLFQILCAVSILLIMNSCTPKEPSHSQWNTKMDQMYDCHTTAALDSTALAQELVGTWNWEYVRSYAWSVYESDEAYEGFSLRLFDDGTFILNQNDTATVQGNWMLENSWIDFSLTTQPYAPTLSGALLHCDGYLMFYSSPADGPDHMYKKE